MTYLLQFYMFLYLRSQYVVFHKKNFYLFLCLSFTVVAIITVLVLKITLYIVSINAFYIKMSLF